MTNQQPVPLRGTATPPCPIDGRCVWTHHAYKHFPKQGITAEHTRRGPAKYTIPAATIRALETETAHSPHYKAGTKEGKAEYLRDLGEAIGWDEGKDATFSYAECCGGTTSGRAYHGRPMHAGNRNVKAMQDGGAKHDHY